MIRPPEDWQAQWLDIQMTRLVVSQLLGFLDRWIKWRIKTATPQQLLQVEREIMDKAREVQKGKASLGAVLKTWSSHPLQKLLFNERLRREYQLESSSEDYLAPLIDGTDIRDYLIWKSEKHGSINDWKKDKKRSLPVIPSRKVGDVETKTDNGGLLSITTGGEDIRSDRPGRLKGPKTEVEEVRAYFSRKKI